MSELNKPQEWWIARSKQMPGLTHWTTLIAKEEAMLPLKIKTRTHVIEYSAYEKLQQEFFLASRNNDDLRSELATQRAISVQLKDALIFSLKASNDPVITKTIRDLYAIYSTEASTVAGNPSDSDCATSHPKDDK